MLCYCQYTMCEKNCFNRNGDIPLSAAGWKTSIRRRQGENSFVMSNRDFNGGEIAENIRTMLY